MFPGSDTKSLAKKVPSSNALNLDWFRADILFLFPITFKNNTTKKPSANLVLFVDEKFSISGLKKYLLNTEFSYISDLLKNSDLKKDLLFFEINSKKTIFLVSIKKDLKTSDIENLGAKFHGYINYDKKNDYLVNSDTVNSKINKLNFFYSKIPKND